MVVGCVLGDNQRVVKHIAAQWNAAGSDWQQHGRIYSQYCTKIVRKCEQKHVAAAHNPFDVRYIVF